MSAPAVGMRVTPVIRTELAAAGELFHACLEHHAPHGTLRDLSAFARQLGINAERHATIEHAARAVITAPHLTRFFHPEHFLHARNEMAILDAEGNTQRLDRVVEFDDEVWVLDYKTGADTLRESDEALHALHGEQLARYSQLLAQLHPAKSIHAALILADARLVVFAPNPCSY